MSGELSLPDLQALLDRHRANQQVYRERVKEINLTRARISDELETLQQTYDRKLKSLEQKLLQLKTHNDELLRQNLLYKAEVETYQARILEKEKIIAALLSQRKDLPTLGSSEKSKSQKTDSLHANEQEAKFLKKHPAPIFKQDFDTIHELSKARQQHSIELKRPERQSQQPKVEEPHHQSPPQIIRQITRPNVPPPPTRKPPPMRPNTSSNPSSNTNLPIQQNSKHQARNSNANIPIPKPITQKSNINSTKKTEPIVSQQEEQNDAYNFFSTLGNAKQQAYEAQNQNLDLHPQKKQIFQHYEPENIYGNYQGQNEAQQQKYQEQNYQAQDNKPHIPLIDKYHEQNEASHTEQLVQNKETERLQPVSTSSYHQQQFASEDNHNNFLSHFSNSPVHYQQQPIRQISRQPKQKKKRAPIQREADTSDASGALFFNQLSRSDNQPSHHLQMQQSSIDHIDSSLISNEQPYLVELSTAPKPKPVKMAKKKTKRDQIKVMDPSCFD